MPIFNITVAGELSKEKHKELYSEVAKTIAKIKECDISAVSGMIHELPLHQMGRGDKDWDTIIEEIKGEKEEN